MLYYCLKCTKNIENKNSKVARTNNRKLMILSEGDVFDSKKSRFVKEKEASEFLTNLVLKIPLCKFQVLGNIMF